MPVRQCLRGLILMSQCCTLLPDKNTKIGNGLPGDLSGCFPKNGDMDQDAQQRMEYRSVHQ